MKLTVCPLSLNLNNADLEKTLAFGIRNNRMVMQPSIKTLLVARKGSKFHFPLFAVNENS
jgi:hypothetical protein